MASYTVPPVFLSVTLYLTLTSVVSALAAFGYCTKCQQQHSIPTTPEAVQHAQKLRQDLESTGRLDFTTKGDPLLDTQLLYETRGKMFGVLVCRNNTSNNETVVLKAFAGKIRSYGWTLDGYVDPIVVPEDIPRFVELRDEVSRITFEMDDCRKKNDEDINTSNSTHMDEWNLLKEHRSELSREALEVIRHGLRVTNFRGDTALLEDVFLRPPLSSMPTLGGKPKQKRQMPVGVGECCATKLIAAAAAQNLRPISIAEFFVGKSDRRRVSDQEFYDACPDRCQKVLGFMLCGCDHEINAR